EGELFRESNLTHHFAELTVETTALENLRARPVSLVAGLSYRKDSFDLKSGPEDMIGLEVHPAEEEGYRGIPPGFVGPWLLQFSGIRNEPLNGEFDVWELFSEAHVPLLEEWGLFQSLDLHLAYRYADYARSGGVHAWKT